MHNCAAKNSMFFLDTYFQIYITCLLSQTEIPSGMCAKLRTVAASNNRVHMP